MLIFDLKVGDCLMIGDEISMEIIQINSKVRLGFIAPKRISIYRKELLESRKENVNARSQEDEPIEKQFDPDLAAS